MNFSTMHSICPTFALYHSKYVLSGGAIFLYPGRVPPGRAFGHRAAILGRIQHLYPLIYTHVKFFGRKRAPYLWAELCRSRAPTGFASRLFLDTTAPASQLIQDIRPVVDGHRPFIRDVLVGQI